MASTLILVGRISIVTQLPNVGGCPKERKNVGRISIVTQLPNILSICLLTFIVGRISIVTQLPNDTEKLE